MRKKRVLIVLGCVFLFVILLYTLSPMMIGSGGIVFGMKVDEFDYQYSLNDISRYNSNKFSHFYMVNVNFNTDLHIKEVTKGRQPEVKRILPFLYSIEQEENSVSSIYEVTRGDDKFYFIYLSP